MAPAAGQPGQTSIYNVEARYNTVLAGVNEYNSSNCTRTQVEIAKSVGISGADLSNFAKQQRNGTFPTSYQQAQSQGRGMGGGKAALRTFAMDNVDVDDTGRGDKSQLVRNYKARFPGQTSQVRGHAMWTVRAIIARLHRQREERAALAAEAPVDDDSSDDGSGDEGDFL